MSAAWEVERALLGGLMLDPTQIADVEGVLDGDCWHRPQHAALWELLRARTAAGRAIDILMVMDDVTAREAGEQYGGLAYLAGMPNACASVENLRDYAVRIREYSLMRRLDLACVAIRSEIHDGQLTVPEQLDSAEQKVLALTRLAPSAEFHSAAELADEQLTLLQERAEHPGSVTGIATGFVDLDRMLAGLQRTDLVIVAARPAMGKTALAMQIAWTAARGDVGVGVFSLEMSRQQLMGRALSMEGRVDAGRMRTGRLNEGDWRQLCDAAERLAGAPVLVSDRPGLTIMELRGIARRMKAQQPSLGLIVVDYLQLMQGQGGVRESRENAISSISRGLKMLAKELGVSVVALSQLNRSLEARTDKRPLPSDLRESGAIEQDADVILFIYRDEYYNPDSADKGLAELIIAKQRSGPTGTVKVAWLGQYTMFQNYASADEVPGGYF